jgi:mono/diheme cytochrome c family protein
VSTNEILVIALGVLVPAALLWAIFIARTQGLGRARRTLGIPAAMRPGSPDEVLEGPRLERIMLFGVLTAVGLSIFLPIYWLPESQRQESFDEHFNEESLDRGELIFAVPPPLPEEADPIAFRRAERQIALGMGCANCHGAEGEGGLVPGGFTDPITGEVVQYRAPPLNTVFTRWDEEVVRFTIERGRPGTPMPAWGQEFGGPMTPQMIDDVINYLTTLPENNEPPTGISQDCEDPSPADRMTCGEEIFTARCAVCHGPRGQGKEEEGLVPAQFPNPDAPDLTALQTEDPDLFRQVGTWYPGLALWDGDVLHLDESLHEQTVSNGRRFAFMPPFAEAPVQGVPAPVYPLTESQIQAVIAYERSL